MIVLAFLLSAFQEVPDSGDPATHLGVWERTLHGLDRPESVAIDDDGRLWVAEAGAGRVSVFDRDGNQLEVYEDLGEPIYLTQQATKMWVVDRSYPSKVLELGSEPRELMSAMANIRAAAMGDDGYISSVEWAPRFPGLPPSSRITDLARLPDGDWLALDSGGHRVLRYDKEFEELASSGGFGFFEGLFAAPKGFDVADGRVFIADTENHRVQVYDLDQIVPRPGPALPAAPRYVFGGHAIRPREGKGSMHYPADIAVANDRSYGAVCEPWDDRVQIFGRGEGAKPKKDPLRQGIGQASPHFGRRIAVSGTLMTIVQPEAQQIDVYTLRRINPDRENDPIEISNFGGLGDRLGLFQRPEGMHLEDRTLLVCDAGAGKLVEVLLDVDPEGEIKQNYRMARFIRAVDLGGEPVAVTRQGDAIVVLRMGVEVELVRIDAKTFLPTDRWEITSLDRPTDLVAGEAGFVLLLTANGVRTVNLETGELSEPVGGDALDEPFGLCRLPDGTLAVTDAGAHKIVHLSASGEVLHSFGSRGIQRGQFLRPSGIAVEGSDLIVIDSGNHRGIRLMADGTFKKAFGPRDYTRPANQPETYKEEDYVE